MIKIEKGVSLVTLVITIVVMVVMISIIIGTSIQSIDEANVTKIDNEIKTLKDAVIDRISNNARNETLYPIVGEKLGDTIFEHIRSIERLDNKEISEIIGNIAGNYSQETSDYYRLVGNIDAEKLGVEGLDPTHAYVVDYIECEVYGPVSEDLINKGE